MDRVCAFVDAVAQDIARTSARLGERVMLDLSALDRSDSLALAAPGLSSANQSARMIKARDGWLAINLPREDDVHAVPALIRAAPNGDAWDMLTTAAPQYACAELLAQGELLGLAVAQVGETHARDAACAFAATGAPGPKRRPLRVIDFSSLWAGPLCGSIFASMGADVVKVDSAERPDPTAQSAPALHARLNGAKRTQKRALSSPTERDALIADIAQADVLITSARQRALTTLGLAPERLFAINPALVWIAVTGHSWASNRIAFGDDAAASGGLVVWRDGAPHFLGDAMADPLTGLAAAAVALCALERGESGFIDASLAQCAAYVAATKP
jgi:hypothetical protein